MWQGTYLGLLHGPKDREAWVASLSPLGALEQEEHLSCRAGQGLGECGVPGTSPRGTESKEDT